MYIIIERFKKILKVELKLDPVNIFIGANNSGKSSFIQGIQFAISSGQTLQLKQAKWVKEQTKTLALDSTDYLYTPTRHIENLYHGQRLTGSQKKGDRKYMSFTFKDNGEETKILVSRGKNGGFTTNLIGKSLGDKLSNIDSPFCVYVPGIAGIPVQEKYEVQIAIKKSATRGDSNNYLRNIIWDISKDQAKWSRFIDSINKIYEGINVKASFRENISEFINVDVEDNKHSLPIDSIGTGLLQTIQVFAYIEYFNPTIILLDEPDAHIHPTKQKLLAQELYKRCEESENLKIVFSTHSRYILDALEEKAKVFHFQNGEAIPDVRGSKILIDIGAADASYLFSKRNLKFIIVTEDKVDNVEEKKEFIKKFVLANGLNEDEIVFHSYEGCTKVDFAKILQTFVAKQIPHVEVIVHFDRDQRKDDDHDLVKLRADCKSRELRLFITEFSEIENYFCQPEHIAEVYNLSADQGKEIYEAAIDGLKELTKDKIENFILRERQSHSFNKDGKPDAATIRKNRDAWYDEFKYQVTPGKEILGKIKSHLQKNLKLDPQLILNISDKLKRNYFAEVLKENANNSELS